MLLTRETTRLPPTARGIIDEDYRLRWEAEMNDKLTPEDAKRIKAGLPPGVEACFRKNIANMDPVTGARPSDPKPSVAALMEADRALGDFLERFGVRGREPRQATDRGSARGDQLHAGQRQRPALRASGNAVGGHDGPIPVWAEGID
jgi:hypothetical protein